VAERRRDAGPWRSHEREATGMIFKNARRQKRREKVEHEERHRSASSRVAAKTDRICYLGGESHRRKGRERVHFSIPGEEKGNGVDGRHESTSRLEKAPYRGLLKLSLARGTALARRALTCFAFRRGKKRRWRPGRCSPSIGRVPCPDTRHAPLPAAGR